MGSTKTEGKRVTQFGTDLAQKIIVATKDSL